MSASSSDQPFQRIGIIGGGNMGSMIALAFCELGVDVSLWDVQSEIVDEAIKISEKVNGKGKVEGFHNPDEFTGSLENTGKRKLYLFSITHGDPADSVLSRIRDKLNPGDISLDGGNEHYRRTEQRQKECAKLGVQWIGMGVSGGYQSARHGPNLSPGGDADALRAVMPLLEAFAAKDLRSGCPCVVPIGPAGSGHYVKMVHNGIEVGMLSTIAEAWYILYHGLGLSYHDIGNLFNKWNSHDELRNTYLLGIGAQILHTRHAAADKKGGDAQDGYVLDEVLDCLKKDRTHGLISPLPGDSDMGEIRRKVYFPGAKQRASIHSSHQAPGNVSVTVMQAVYTRLRPTVLQLPKHTSQLDTWPGFDISSVLEAV